MAKKKFDPKKQRKKGIRAGILAFGVVFFVYCLLFHLNSLSDLLLASGLGLLIGWVLGVMVEGQDFSAPSSSQPESLQRVQADTGIAEVDALLEKGREAISQIRQENDLIPDSQLTQQLNQLEQKCADIFQTISQNPDKAPQIRKFMDYYLPTTLKMVRGYRNLDEQKVSSLDAQAAKNRIVDALNVVLQACDKTRENLFRKDVLDLNIDMDVLEEMLKRDGLTQSDLDMAAAQAKAAAVLDAKVAQRAQAKATQAAKMVEVPQPVPSPKSAVEPQPVPFTSHWQMDTGIAQQVEELQKQAQNHVPQVPTLSGTLYPTATAQAPEQKR